MRVRTYGLMLLCLVGIVPLGVYGYLAIARSQETSVEQIRTGNQHLAHSIAWSITQHIEADRRLIGTVGAAILQAREREQAHDAFQLGPSYEHFYDLVIYALGQSEPVVVAGRVPEAERETYARLVATAMTGTYAYSDLTSAATEHRFSHTIVVAEPIWIVGELEGIAIARYDLIGLWAAVGAERVGETGFVRLVTEEGMLLAHGHPDERRAVFITDEARNRALLEAVEDGTSATTLLGREVIAAASPVVLPQWFGRKWLVVVEQTVAEAYADVESMKRNLAIVGAGALSFVIIIGLLVGRRLVRALERLRSYTRELAGDLSRRIDGTSSFVEVREVAGELNAMATALVAERESAKARERLTTFARVAAGLAHDLRLPIEALYGACEDFVHGPDDEVSRRTLRRVSQRDLPRLKRFVDDLQRLARSGDLELEREPVSPRALVEDVARELQGTPKWQGVEVCITGSAEPAMLDQGLVRRAVLNLAGNAADACLEKGYGNRVTLEIGDERDAEGEHLVIRVIDTGSGIPADNLAILERGDFQSTKRVSGIGLGLGVVRQVIAAHQGQLRISSRVGDGSTFMMRLLRHKTSRNEIIS